MVVRREAQARREAGLRRRYRKLPGRAVRGPVGSRAGVAEYAWPPAEVFPEGGTADVTFEEGE